MLFLVIPQACPAFLKCALLVIYKIFILADAMSYKFRNLFKPDSRYYRMLSYLLHFKRSVTIFCNRLSLLV